MKKISVIGGGLLLMSGAAYSAVVEVVWDRDNRFSYHGEVGAGKAVEVCESLSKGLEVRWEFNSSIALDFNIHYHTDKAVEFPAKQENVKALEGKLVAPVDQDYCWMWKNPADAPVQVQVHLQKE